MPVAECGMIKMHSETKEAQTFPDWILKGGMSSKNSFDPHTCLE